MPSTHRDHDIEKGPLLSFSSESTLDEALDERERTLKSTKVPERVSPRGSLSRRVRRIVVAIIAFLLVARSCSWFLTLLFPSSEQLSGPPKYFDKIALVDQRIGTGADGNVWLGASVPNGIVKVGVDSKWTQQGFSPTKPIRGISQLHVSGTGGGDSYQVISVHPVNGGHEELLRRYEMSSSDGFAFALNSSRSEEDVGLGWYKVGLDEAGVAVEVAATRTSSIHQYTLMDTPSSSNDKQKTVVIDVGQAVGGDRSFILGNVSVAKHGTEVHGMGRYVEFWAGGMGLRQDTTYDVYFCAHLDKQPVSWGYWDNGGLQSSGAVETTHAGVNHYGPHSLGAFFTYDTANLTRGDKMVNVSLAISFKSSEKACENLDMETYGKSIEDLKLNAENEWSEKLDLIHVEGPINGVFDASIHNPATFNDQMKVFYSSLYRTFLMPVNASGENPKFESDDYFNDHYCLWDTFRTLHPLYTLISPHMEKAIVRSLIEIQENEGFLPDCRVGNLNGITQSGSSAEVVISDAFAKNLSDIDWTRAWKSLKHDITVEPRDWLYEGRGGIEEWNTINYIPDDATAKAGFGDPYVMYHRSAARTLEYSYNDFCMSQIAAEFGTEKDLTDLKNHSSNWQNLWNPEIRSLNNITGFIQPKSTSGVFSTLEKDTDVTLCSNINKGANCGFHGSEFYEESGWTYSFYAPHQVAKLVSLDGGKDYFTKRLDTFFDKGLYNPGNEPAFLTPYLYNYVCRPDLTTDRVRWILKKYFNSQVDGVPGNDDAGTMAALYIFSSIGIFPVAGQDLYLIGAPHFQVSILKLAEGKELRIEAHDLSHEKQYIAKVLLNGKVLDGAFFKHSEISGGGKLEFFMTDVKSSDWCLVNPPSYL